MEAVIIIVIVLAAIHLLGGAHSHVKHRRRGLRPRLYWTYGMGWYGSFRLGGWRIGHKL